MQPAISRMFSANDGHKQRITLWCAGRSHSRLCAGIATLKSKREQTTLVMGSVLEHFCNMQGPPEWKLRTSLRQRMEGKISHMCCCRAILDCLQYQFIV